MPGGYTSKQFTEFVLASTGIVVTPGNSYGAQGEGYFRMSLTVPDAEVDEACKRLSGLQFVPPADEAGKDLVGQRAGEE